MSIPLPDPLPARFAIRFPLAVLVNPRPLERIGVTGSNVSATLAHVNRFHLYLSHGALSLEHTSNLVEFHPEINPYA